MVSKSSIRIGGASGFWGDSSVGAPQLVQLGKVDYVVFDYLAELTMSVLAAARLKNPDLGYATDFVTVTMKAILKDVVAKNIKIVSNAGGMNPHACAAALAAIAAEQGVAVKIGWWRAMTCCRSSRNCVKKASKNSNLAHRCPSAYSALTPTWAPPPSSRR
jgi:hypothetical protein